MFIFLLFKVYYKKVCKSSKRICVFVLLLLLLLINKWFLKIFFFFYFIFWCWWYLNLIKKNQKYSIIIQIRSVFVFIFFIQLDSTSNKKGNFLIKKRSIIYIYFYNKMKLIADLLAKKQQQQILASYWLE